MGQAHQAVALRVAAGEQGAARRRAQRRSGVRAGEQDALCGQLIEPRAGDIGMAVRAEVTAEVVPMHEQHVVASLGHLLSFPAPVLPRSCPVGTPNSAHGDSATLWLTASNLSTVVGSSTGWASAGGRGPVVGHWVGVVSLVCSVVRCR